MVPELGLRRRTEKDLQSSKSQEWSKERTLVDITVIEDKGGKSAKRRE